MIQETFHLGSLLGKHT
uniref:Uncharacterized protein n=1 Tax=Rhizophora mucronata TaxID=61149 RepID=A0A2P2QBW7_RHIMU